MSTNHNQNYSGSYFMVSGLNQGREVFIGKAVDEPFQGNVCLEGKVMGFTPQGFLVVRPFSTLANFPVEETNSPCQRITDPAVVTEATNLLNSSATQVHRVNYPLIHSWMDSCVKPEVISNWVTTNTQRAAWWASNPWFNMMERFNAGAEHFHYALFMSPQVNSTEEMDKLTEVQGSLTIELGKIANRITVTFNQILARETHLTEYLQAFQGVNQFNPVASHSAGWLYLNQRLDISKVWARQMGKTALVREINEIMKEGFTQLNESILSHSNSLDTLIAETINLYGITPDMYTGVTTLTGIATSPVMSPVETFEPSTPHAPQTFSGSGFAM